MESLRTAGMSMRSPALLVLLMCAVVVIIPQVSGRRLIVGANMGWSANVNYTIWASKQHFYLGDWLFFVYDRNQMDVLEVNKTNYESCNTDHPLKNYTTGAGRDVVHLNETRHYYFASSKGFCYSGMKLAVKVVKPPPPPSAAPVKSEAPRNSYRSQFVLPLAFAIGAVWDSLLQMV